MPLRRIRIKVDPSFPTFHCLRNAKTLLVNSSCLHWAEQSALGLGPSEVLFLRYVLYGRSSDLIPCSETEMSCTAPSIFIFPYLIRGQYMAQSACDSKREKYIPDSLQEYIDIFSNRPFPLSPLIWFQYTIQLSILENLALILIDDIIILCECLWTKPST